MNLAPNKVTYDFQCSICKMLCENKIHLNDHMSTHSDDGDWTCGQCSFQVNSKNALKNHLRASKHSSPHIITPEAKDTFTCKLCGKCFGNNIELKEHRIANHKTYKPCRNISNCAYG